MQIQENLGGERVIGENTDELPPSVENRNDRTKPESKPL